MLRFFAALVAAILSIAMAVLVAALLSMMLSQKASEAATVLCVLVIPILTFSLVYGLMPKSRRALRAEVQERQHQAVSRRIPEKALKIAGGGEGTWQTATWRVTGRDMPSIEILENGAWATVFQARFHPGEDGQWVPSKITRDYFLTPGDPVRDHKDPHTIHSTRAGGHPAWWEILVYRPGAWEEELDDQVSAAEAAALSRDRDRMELT